MDPGSSSQSLAEYARRRIGTVFASKSAVWLFTGEHLAGWSDQLNLKIESTGVFGGQLYSVRSTSQTAPHKLLLANSTTSCSTIDCSGGYLSSSILVLTLTV